jgi:hypothetical protein
MYSPQHFADGSDIPAWTGTLDWRVPIWSYVEISGEFFNGRGLDGFGGLGIAATAPSGEDEYAYTTLPTLARIRNTGGWGQFKWKFNSRHEANMAAGYGGRYSKSLRNAATADPYLLGVPARNETLFVNYIFRPRSDLILSMEYRRLRTFGAVGSADTADRVGVAAGFLF